MIENLSWLGRNNLRSYPLREDVPANALSSGWILPDSVIVDAYIVSPYDQIYLSAITISAALISVTIASAQTGQSLATASAMVGQPFVQAALVPLQPGVSGYISFGTILNPGEFALAPKGMNTFSSGLLFETRAVLATGPFPVTTLSAHYFPQLQGLITIQEGQNLAIAETTGLDGGDPITFLTLNLNKPLGFISPCENPATQCQCKNLPIQLINGVGADGGGNLTIELVDENGQIIPFDPGVLNFLLTAAGSAACNRPLMPDQYGRLPDASGNYSADQPPTTPYQNPSDTTFPTPVI